MAKSLLPEGVQEVRFKTADDDIALFARMIDWSDTRKPRLAQHEYLKRDGALQEPMGRAAHVIKMTLVFVGEKFVTDFAKLTNAIDKNPKGTLTHPLYGSMQVACQGYEGATLNVEQGRNLYTVPISFIEDNVDKTDAIKTKGLASQQQEVENRSNKILLQISRFAAAAQGLQNLVNAAISFSIAAFDNQGLAILSPALNPQLQALSALTVAAVQGLKDDPESDPEPVCYDTVADCEILYDACVQMLAALSVAKPPLVSFTVPIQMHVANLAQRLYGQGGREKIDSILANNPGLIPNPAAIAAGTILLVESPTIPQD